MKRTALAWKRTSSASKVVAGADKAGEEDQARPDAPARASRRRRKQGVSRHKREENNKNANEMNLFHSRLTFFCPADGKRVHISNFTLLIESFFGIAIALHNPTGAMAKCRGARQKLNRPERNKMPIDMAKLALAAEQAKQAKLKVLRNFYKYAGPQLVPFASNVATNLDPTKFLNLPFTPEEVQALADDLKMKLAATITGGPASFAAKDKSFDALTAALNADADIVQITVQGDLEMLLNTGYLPASTNRASSPLDDTTILKLLNNGTTQLFLQLATVVNAKSYQVLTSADGGKTWQDAVVSSKANRIVLANLVPGTSYLVRARAIGGSTGASNWIVSGSIICT